MILVVIRCYMQIYIHLLRDGIEKEDVSFYFICYLLLFMVKHKCRLSIVNTRTVEIFWIGMVLDLVMHDNQDQIQSIKVQWYITRRKHYIYRQVCITDDGMSKLKRK